MRQWIGKGMRLQLKTNLDDIERSDYKSARQDSVGSSMNVGRPHKIPGNQSSCSSSDYNLGFRTLRSCQPICTVKRRSRAYLILQVLSASRHTPVKSPPEALFASLPVERFVVDFYGRLGRVGHVRRQRHRVRAANCNQVRVQ
jgi:hypothetical protein